MPNRKKRMLTKMGKRKWKKEMTMKMKFSTEHPMIMLGRMHLMLLRRLQIRKMTALI